MLILSLTWLRKLWRFNVMIHSIRFRLWTIWNSAAWLLGKAWNGSRRPRTRIWSSARKRGLSCDTSLFYEPYHLIFSKVRLRGWMLEVVWKKIMSSKSFITLSKFVVFVKINHQYILSFVYKSFIVNIIS